MHLIRDFKEFAGYTPKEVDMIVEKSIKNYANFEVRNSSFYWVNVNSAYEMILLH